MADVKDAWLAEITMLREAQQGGDKTMATDQRLTDAVRKCRQLGCTWQQIGDRMGTSRQYVQKRFGETTG